jgi:hypothetical protein
MLSNYGTPAILGAQVLPATTTAGILLLDSTSPWIVAGFITVGYLSLVFSFAYVSRFLINRKAR